VVDAIGECEDLVVVGHSFGGFTAALVAERLAASQLIYVAAMIPSPGERPADWREHTGYAEAVAEQARLDGGLTGHEDPYLSFYHQVPRELADEAMRRSRGQTMTSSQAPWPLAQHPAVPTHVLVCRDDRFFPAELLHRVTRERLGIEAQEVPGCHGAMLSHPHELAEALMCALPGAPEHRSRARTAVSVSAMLPLASTRRAAGLLASTSSMESTSSPAWSGPTKRSLRVCSGRSGRSRRSCRRWARVRSSRTRTTSTNRAPWSAASCSSCSMKDVRARY